MLRVMENVTFVSTTLEHKNYPLSHILDKKKGTYWESNNNKLLESTIFDLGKRRSLRSFYR